MSVRINCVDLGIEDCDYTASGEVPIEALENMVKHLRTKHDLDMPDAELILSDEEMDENEPQVEPGVAVVVKRLRELLEVGESEAEDQPKPAMGRTTT